MKAFDDLKTSGPQGSYDAQRDIPTYKGYYVERIEVDSPADAVKPDWSKAKRIVSVRAIDGSSEEVGRSSSD